MKKIFLSAACLVVCTAAAFVWSNNKSKPQIDLLVLNAEALAQNDINIDLEPEIEEEKICWLDPSKDYSCYPWNPRHDSACAPCFK